MPSPFSLTIPTSFGDVPVSGDERGSGRPVVLLHGGAGPVSVAGFADLLAEGTGSRVITPIHPGFGGTPRPEALTSVAGLAEVYAGLLDVLGLDRTVVIGNSIGGWIAAELAIRRPARLGRIVLVDAVGSEVEGHPVSDDLSPASLVQRSWYDPSKARIPDPARLSPEALVILRGNGTALTQYGGTMVDPTLLGRLGVVEVPALVVWGEADRIADPDHGRAYAAAIPDARFELLEHTGHVPQLETPELLLGAIRDFIRS
ncbi:alpha/beta fold hydrolase [uncultured Amnibacterium sp.]|uniref:alpha/beta fold hydrolase n=1 Tax=uncultured Amnibacterium sp. TaxID=1631851 RepID=UPI0035CBD586